MTPKMEGWNITLVGHWNRMIFTPQWVGRNVFQENNIKASVLVPTFDMTFRDEIAALDLGEGRVTIRPHDTADRSLKKCESMADNVLGILKHTPLTAIGLNYAFSEADLSPRLANLFNFSDTTELGSADWVSEEKRIQRRLRHEEQIMNLILTSNSNGITIDMNFHYETGDAEQARETVRGRFVANRVQAIQFLREAYDLSVEGA